MLAFVFSLALLVLSAEPSGDFDTCLAMGPERVPPPVTTLNEAQRSWRDGESVPPDTLRAHLNRIRRARSCLQDLDPEQIDRPYLEHIMHTYTAEAILHASLRQFSAAFDAYENGLAYLKSRSSDEYVGYDTATSKWPTAVHRQHGYLHYILGNLSASIEQYLKAYRRAPSPSTRVEHLINIGILHQRTQDYESAHRYYQRGKQLFEKNNLHSEDQSQWARILQNQADLLLEKTLNAKFDREALHRARDLAERARASAQPGTGYFVSASLTLSESLGYLGSFERAYSLNDQVRQHARANDNPRDRTFALLKLGVLHIQTQQWSAANSTLHRARAHAQELGDLDYQRRILRAMGRLHEMRGTWDTAEKYYREGVEVIEKYRSSLTASQWSVTAFAQWRDVHRGLVRTLLAQDREREALEALDRSRARHLQDLRTQARVSTELSPKKQATLDSLSRALTDVRNQLAVNTLSEDEEAELRTQEANIMAARQQLLQLDSVSQRPPLETISDTLAQQERALVSYFLDDPWPVYDRSPRSAAFVVSGDTVRAIALPGLTQDSVQSVVERTSRLFSSKDASGPANLMHFNLQPLHELHEALYAPISEQLPSNRPLTVIPDGPLFRVPFSMLVHSMPEGRLAPSAARFVLHDRPTSFELASSIVATPDRSKRPSSSGKSHSLVGFGVSEFDTHPDLPSDLRATLPGGGLDSSLALPSLPGVRSELESLRQRVEDSRILLDEAATEEAFWQTTNRSDIVHLASHAFVHPTTPLQNAFLLRPDTSRESADGVLFLHELQTRRRPFSLVVLSGCNTARGSLLGGEGMEGLQYAFRAMGTQATISSLWPVADRANAGLMDAFYRHLEEGLRKDEALRQAKLEQLESDPSRASPFFWAPTVLYGSPSPVSLTSGFSLPPWVWWMLGVSVVFMAGLAALRWQKFRRPLRVGE